MTAVVSSIGNLALDMEALTRMSEELPPLNPGSAITPENIKRRRKELQLTQEDLGKLAGVSSRAVGAWERAESNPEGKAREKLAEILALEFSPARRSIKRDDVANDLQLARTLVRQAQQSLNAIELVVNRALGLESDS